MGNPLQKVIKFFSASSSSRTISIIVILIIAAAIPLTVIVSQQQQETRQHAATSGTPPFNSTTLSWNHTISSGSNRVLIVSVSLKTDTPISDATALPTVTGITYAGTPLLKKGSFKTINNIRNLELWYLVNPAPETNPIVVNVSSGSSIVGGATSWSGVNQTTPLAEYLPYQGSGMMALAITTWDPPNPPAPYHLTVGPNDVVIDTITTDQVGKVCGLSVNSPNGIQTIRWAQNQILTGTTGLYNLPGYSNAAGGSSTRAGYTGALSWLVNCNDSLNSNTLLYQVSALKAVNSTTNITFGSASSNRSTTATATNTPTPTASICTPACASGKICVNGACINQPVNSLTPTLTPAPSGNTISGKVFIDSNGSGTFDTGEQGYFSNGGNMVYLYLLGVGPTGQTTYTPIGWRPTDESGYYLFENLRAGRYQISYQPPLGYIQTTFPGVFNTDPIPPNQTHNFGLLQNPNCNAGNQCAACTAPANTCNGQGTRTCTFTRYQLGNLNTENCTQVSTPESCTAPANCNIGYICNASQQCVAPTGVPTATPTPTTPAGATATPTPTIGTNPTATPQPTIPSGNTVFALNIGLDGLGTTGDNVAPLNHSGSNKNPLHPSRNVTIEVFNTDTNNTLVANKSGEIVYQASSGKFTGNVDMGSLASGNYNIKVKSNGYLRRLIPGQNVTGGQTFNVPAARLVTGDINGDNAINILDYNIFIACSIFNRGNTGACTDAYRPFADLDDNGTIDQFDYNLFIRELSVQNGD